MDILKHLFDFIDEGELFFVLSLTLWIIVWIFIRQEKSIAKKLLYYCGSAVVSLAIIYFLGPDDRDVCLVLFVTGAITMFLFGLLKIKTPILDKCCSDSKGGYSSGGKSYSGGRSFFGGGGRSGGGGSSRRF